jgi:hypothetical protein
MWEKKYELDMGNFKSKYQLYKVFGFMITQIVFYIIRVVTTNAIY